MTDQVAILLDGGFVKKRLKLRLKRFPATADVVELSTTIMGHDRLKNASLFRVFFYDAPPYEGTSANPLEPSSQSTSARLRQRSRTSPCWTRSRSSLTLR
jgi:hypothetical protein